MRIVLLLVFLAGAWVIFAPNRGLYHYSRLQREIDRLGARNSDLARQNRNISREIDRLQHDDAYLENLARRRYGMLRENEIVYQFSQKKKEQAK